MVTKEELESENIELKDQLQKANYYLDMFARGKRLTNLGKKEQLEFKEFHNKLQLRC